MTKAKKQKTIKLAAIAIPFTGCDDDDGKSLQWLEL